MDFLFERLAWLTGQAPDHMPWRVDVLKLCSSEARAGKSMPEAGKMLVEAARMLRATHQIQQEAYFYVVCWVVEHLAEDEISELYRRRFAPKFQAIEQTYQMQPYWEFREGQEPPEYVELSGEFDREMVAITAGRLRSFQEPVLAELYERDRAEFLRVKQTGRVSFFGVGNMPAVAPS